MTDPAAPGVPEGGQNPGGEPPAPGAQDPAPQNDPKPAQALGKPNHQGQGPAPGASDPKPAEPPKEDPKDVSALPDWAQKLIKDARADAGKARTTAKQQAAEEARTALLAEISKTLGLDVEGEPTVDDLAKQLDERQTRINELEAAQTEHAYRDAVRTAASAVSADAEALLDSGSFRDAVAGELGEEFDDDDLKKVVAKIAKEYVKKPRFAKQTAPARSGGEITGGPPPATKQRPRSLKQAVDNAYPGGF
jgi:hypothetical protein